MVNKAFLSLAAVVLFAVFGTGVFVGMQVGGGGVAGPTETGPQATDVPTTDTPASGSESTPTPSQGDDGVDSRDPVPPREFNERNISEAIVQNINDARGAEGLESLSTTGSTAESLQQMASGHSDAMADVGRVRHTIDGVTSRDRYEREGLYQTCQFQEQSYIASADNDDLEVVGRTYAGQEYPANGTQQFNANDTAVADALTEEWLSSQLFRERLFYENAGRIGVGVTVTNTGVVYATANVC